MKKEEEEINNNIIEDLKLEAKTFYELSTAYKKHIIYNGEKDVKLFVFKSGLFNLP